MKLSRAAIVLFTTAMLASGVKAQTKKGKPTKKPATAKPTKSPTVVCNNESGYEVWRTLPPADAKVKFESEVDCDTKTYTLKFSFAPDDMNLPFIQNITRVDPNGAIALPEKAEICLKEGMGPGLQENVPAGTHVGLQEHYTIFVAGYKTSKRVQEATGFKELTLAAAPCGTPFQAYSHYGIYFHNVDTEARKKMVCRSKGGYFCESAIEQCSKAGNRFQTDFQGIEMCDDGVTYANVPPNFSWAGDIPAIGANAAMPAVGLHGMDFADLGPIFSGNFEAPLPMMVQYDSNIVSQFVAVWAGTALGQNNPGNDFNWSRDFAYQCHNKVKYPSLPVKKSVDYIAMEGRTYITMTGPTSKCKKSFSEMWDSTSGPSSKASKFFD